MKIIPFSSLGVNFFSAVTSSPVRTCSLYSVPCARACHSFKSSALSIWVEPRLETRPGSLGGLATGPSPCRSRGPAADRISSWRDCPRLDRLRAAMIGTSWRPLAGEIFLPHEGDTPPGAQKGFPPPRERGAHGKMANLSSAKVILLQPRIGERRRHLRAALE